MKTVFKHFHFIKTLNFIRMFYYTLIDYECEKDSTFHIPIFKKNCVLFFNYVIYVNEKSEY